jgi:hypothetical protein
VETSLYCQHYGKSLSVEHWEETCEYYMRHFPFDTYGRKWRDRKGRAIHTQSDFMRPCTSGVTRSSRMRSRFDLSKNRTAPPASRPC